MGESKKTVLELNSITKSFAGNKALDRVSLKVSAGEVIALMGENGAGKSTLMKILCGVWPHGSYEGEIRIGDSFGNGFGFSSGNGNGFGSVSSGGSGNGLVSGLECGSSTEANSQLSVQRFTDTRDAHHAGVAMIHQELSVFPELTVAEHLELDTLPRFINWSRLFARTQTFLDGLNFGLRASGRVRDLSVGGQQLVEIARALYRKASLLIFDEPTSALSEKEVSRLYTTIDELRDQGKAIIYISHRMDEIFRLADRIVILRDGKNAGELETARDGIKIPRAELEPKIITAMVGRPLDEIYPEKNKTKGEELLRVTNLCVRNPRGKVLVNDLSFSVKRGEVLGFGGLLGAGRSEAFEALFGVLRPHGPKGSGFQVRGNLYINQRRIDVQSPADAIRMSMGYVSEDRKGTGLVLGQSILKNMTLPLLSGHGRELASGNSVFSLIREQLERSQGEGWRKQLRIKCHSLDQTVGELSGGNQQKVVLAKWMLITPEILFLDEPTRGVDIGAKAEIYSWVRKLADEGVAILVASSEMPELIGISDRIVVLREGVCSAEYASETVSQEDIMRAASL